MTPDRCMAMLMVERVSVIAETVLAFTAMRQRRWT
jgi:hypothetical protein